MPSKFLGSRTARTALALTFGASALALAIAACGTTPRDKFGADDGDGPGTGQDGSTPAPEPTGNFEEDAAAPEAGPGTCTQDIDVVFVLDVSSSMDFVLNALATDIPKVVDAANGLKDGAHFGLVFYVDNHMLDVTGDQSSGKVHTAAASMTAAFQNVYFTYTIPNRQPGDGPTGLQTQNPICEENALDALYAAATDYPWRPNAARVIIVATDDTFIEKPDNYGDRDHDGKTDKKDFPREGDYPAVHDLDETIAALKTAQARVFSFTRLGPVFSLSNCGTGHRFTQSDAMSYGWSKPYFGKTPIAEATGGKNYDLDAVRTKKVSLTDTINEVVLESHCAGPPR